MINAKKRTLFRLRGSGRISGLRTTKAFRRLCFQLAFQVSLNLQINAGAITVSSFRTIRFIEIIYVFSVYSHFHGT